MSIKEFNLKPPSPTGKQLSVIGIITGGCITGALQVVLSSSYAALIYGGVLNAYLGQGICFALSGAMVIAIMIALFAAWPGTVGSNQDVSVAIFSIISASIVTSMPDGASPESTFATVVVAISLGVFCTGIFFWGMGVLRLGGLIRYFPYPVVGGFLAGTGWLLFIGGLSLACGEWSWSELTQSGLTARWLPSVVFALGLLFVVRRWNNIAILPGAILSGFVIFYGTASSVGISVDELREGGWLLGPFSDERLWNLFTIKQLFLVEWSVIAEQTANIITVVSVCSIALLLNASAFELEARKEVDLDKELQLAGIANCLSCFFHSFVGFRQLALTLLNLRMNAHSRLVGLIGAAILLLTLVFGTSLISYFPRPIIGGIVMYLGLNFLLEWAWETYFKLTKIDFAIIWMVLIVIAVFGFIQGIGVGLFAAIIMFVVSYSRTEVIRHELTGSDCQSVAPRTLVQRKILTEQSERLYILQLQGFIFFGTANRLFNKIRKRLQEHSGFSVRFIVLDFQRIDILDSTGILSFMKLKNLTDCTNTHLIFTSASSDIKQQLIAGGLCAEDPLTHYFSSLHLGIEWYEEQILYRFSVQDTKNIPLAQQLAVLYPEYDCIGPLLSYLECIDIEPGELLVRAGETAEGFFFIESGGVDTRRGKANSLTSTLPVKNGTTIGDICFYLGENHVTDVIAIEPCTVYKVSKERLLEIEKEAPEVAVILHKIMARLLAKRITRLLETVNVLQK